MSTAPPKLLGEVPAASADIYDCAAGNGPVIGLDLIGSITGEEGVAGFRLVLFTQKGPKEGEGAAKRRVLELPVRYSAP